jgi:hypothetical protein
LFKDRDETRWLEMARDGWTWRVLTAGILSDAQGS